MTNKKERKQLNSEWEFNHRSAWNSWLWTCSSS